MCQGTREFLTIHGRAGLVDHAVALDDAVGVPGLPPGHVDRGGGQLTEVNEAGRAGSWNGRNTRRGEDERRIREEEKRGEEDEEDGEV